MSANRVLESYGSDKDFIKTCEKSRMNVCSDHSLKPSRAHRAHRTDRNGK